MRPLLLCLLVAALAPAWNPALVAAPPFAGGQPDSTQIKRLRSLGDNPIEVRLLDGTEINGRAVVTDSGLVLTDSYWRNASDREDQTAFARWNEIDSIHPVKKVSKGIVVFLVSVSALALGLLWGFSNFD